MRRRHALLTAILILAVVSSVVIAATTSRTYEDGPAYSTDWNQSTYSGELAQENYNSTPEPIQLEYHEVSDSEGEFSDYSTISGGFSTGSRVVLPTTKSEGTENQIGTLSQIDIFGIAPNAAGNPRYLEDDGGAIGSQAILRSKDGNKICTYGAGSASSLAKGGPTNYDFVSVFRDSNGYHDLRGVYGSPDCNTEDLGITLDGNARGLARLSGDQYAYVDGSNNEIRQLDIGDGSEFQRFSIENGQQRGLATKFFNGNLRFFVSYSDAQKILVYDENGNKLDSIPLSQNGGGASWFNDRLYYVGADGSNSYAKELFYLGLWKSDSAEVVYKHSLDGDVSKYDTNTIEWSGYAPATYTGDGGSLTLEVRGTSGWSAVDTVSNGHGQFIDRQVTLDSDFEGVDDLEYRISVSGYRYKGSGVSNDVEVNDVSWSYDYYSNHGAVTSTWVDTSKVKAFENLTLNGNSGGQNFDVRVLDKDGNIEYQEADVRPNETLNLSSVPTDYSTQEVKVQFELQSAGLSSPSLTGYKIQWLASTVTPPNITSHYAEVGSKNTSNTTVTTAIGSTDTFVIGDVNKSVDSVRWYVNGEELSSSTVSGDGPFTFNRTWESKGEYTVTGVVENSSGGLDYVEWDVTVYNILMSGQNSFTRDPLGAFSFNQFFKVYNVPDANILVSVTYNDSLLIRHSGPTETTITSGQELNWEFQVREGIENYSGNPITITATYNNYSTTKKIQLSVAKSGGSAITGDPDGYLSNPTTDSPPLIAIGLGGIVIIYLEWILEILGWMPSWLWKELDRIRLVERAVGTVVFGAFLFRGVFVPMTLISSTLLGYWWFFLRGESR